MNEVLVAHHTARSANGKPHRLDHRLHRVRGTKAEALRGVSEREALCIFSIWITVRPPEDGGLIEAPGTSVIANDRLPDLDLVRGEVGRRHSTTPSPQTGARLRFCASTIASAISPR